MQYEESDQKCGLRGAGSYITIMCLVTVFSDSSWQNIQFIPFHNPPIHLISPLLTYFYSINSKLPLKEENFRQWNATNDL
jgi:hypothetical protein